MNQEAITMQHDEFRKQKWVIPVYGLSVPKSLQSSQGMFSTGHPSGHLATSFKAQ